ncbi:transposase [Mediterraneibacter massiliensis]|uniref:transposase n=1 Tax=Mediterraneibacter TaxID=2316020 RepID=UPI0022DEDFDB|nr:transposase [Mediterraneibacter massiliensis]
MDYNDDNDTYCCRNGQILTVRYEKKEKTVSGYKRTVTVYQCNHCKDCPFKTEYIRATIARPQWKNVKKCFLFQK